MIIASAGTAIPEGTLNIELFRHEISLFGLDRLPFGLGFGQEIAKPQRPYRWRPINSFNLVTPAQRRPVARRISSLVY
jgi:hypothetical protein